MSHTQLNYAFVLFWSIFGLIHWNLLFLVQKVIISERSSEILRKFLLIFVQCYWFDQKQLFKQIQIFLWIFHFSNWLRKTNFWVFLSFFLRLSLFGLKREVFIEYPRKRCKIQESIVYSVWLILRRKKVLVNICPLLLVRSKQFV